MPVITYNRLYRHLDGHLWKLKASLGYGGFFKHFLTVAASHCHIYIRWYKRNCYIYESPLARRWSKSYQQLVSAYDFKWQKSGIRRNPLWRGLWTWPQWVFCAPALNHKLKKVCIYRGFSEIVFLRKPHKRTEEIRIGQWKGYFMVHWGSGTPQPANKFKMAERRIKFQGTQ